MTANQNINLTDNPKENLFLMLEQMDKDKDKDILKQAQCFTMGLMAGSVPKVKTPKKTG